MNRKEIEALRWMAKMLIDSGTDWCAGLAWLLDTCEKLDRSVDISFDSGWRQSPGESLDDWSEPYLVKSERGYSIQISGYYTANDDDTERKWDNMGEAISAGLYLLDSVLAEEVEG